jgi:exopolysaccharide production protein ExoQ
MRFFDRYFPVLFALPFLFATMSFEPLRAFGEGARWGVLFLAAGLAALKGFSRGGGRVGIGTRDAVILSFLGLFLLSALWSITPSTTMQRSIAVALVYVASFWYFWAWADRHSDGRLVDLLLRTLAVVLGLNLILGGAFAPSTLISGRFQGLFTNPNNIGLIVSLAIPLSFGRAIASRRRNDWLLWGLFVFNDLACGSRGALFGSLAGMALILSLSATRRPLMVLGMAGAFAVVLGLLWGSDVFHEKVIRADTFETMSNRTVFWELAKEIYIPARPGLGHGFGSDELIHVYYGVDIKDLKLRGYGVMSSYYGLAVAVGVPATVLFFVPLWLGTLFPMFRYRTDTQLVACGAAVVSGLLVSIVEPALYSAGNCFAFLFWTVLMVVLRRASYRRAGVRLGAAGELLRAGRRSLGRQNVRPHRARGIESHENPALHGHL